MMKKLLSIVVFTVLSGCSVAPFNTTTTARSLGDGVTSLSGSLPIPGGNIQHGLTSRWDVGAGIEYQLEPVVTFQTKYALINRPEKGFSLSLLAGAGFGTSVGRSRSGYPGIAMSYRYDWFEPFLIYRKNFVKWTNNLSSSQYDDLLDFIPRKMNFNYDQLDAGFNFSGEKFTIGIGGKVLVFEGKGSVVPFATVGVNL